MEKNKDTGKNEEGITEVPCSASLCQLLPCPFCGGNAGNGTVKYSEDSDIAELNGQSLYFYVNCISCGSDNKGLVGHRTQQEAHNHWNTRT